MPKRHYTTRFRRSQRSQNFDRMCFYAKEQQLMSTFAALSTSMMQCGKPAGVISIAREDVPTFLQGGKFFESMQPYEDNARDESIVVPVDCFTIENSISTQEDLLNLLRALRFWIVLELPTDCGLIEYASDPENRETFIATSLEFEEYLPYIKILRSIIREPTVLDRMRAAARMGQLPVMQGLCEHAPDECWSPEVCCEAAKDGHLECLKYAHMNGCPWDEELANVCSAFGQLSCLEYATKRKCRLHADCVRKAFSSGHVSCLQFLYENTNATCKLFAEIAAGTGGLKCVQYMHENGFDFSAQQWLLAAVKADNLEVVRFLVELGHHITEETARQAAHMGRLTCLRYMRVLDPSWGDMLCTAAAFGNQLPCLVYLRDAGCGWSARTLRTAVQGNSLECLQYLLEQRCPRESADTFASAVKLGHATLLPYLLEPAFIESPAYCTIAAQNGRLDCLKYLHERGFPWDKTTSYGAVRSVALGDREYSQALQNWGSVTLRRGALDCLKYAHEHGCPCDRTLLGVLGMPSENVF